MFRVHNAMPAHGQFIVVWLFNGQLWCEIMNRSRNGELTYYENTSDSFIACPADLLSFMEHTTVQYLVKLEDN